ncbi:MAG: hypothetical protein WCJ13_00365 [Coriobacteriia bacterium]
MKRSIRGLTIGLVLLALVFPVAGCEPTGDVSPEDQKVREQAIDADIGALNAQVQEDAAAAASATPPPAAVIVEDPVGTWSYRPMRNDGTAAKPKWSEGKSTTLVIAKSGDGYSAKTAGGAPEVIFDGKRITIDGSAQGVTIEYIGDVTGDSIVGTVHIAAGPLVYDGPWTATRVK